MNAVALFGISTAGLFGLGQSRGALPRATALDSAEPAARSNPYVHVLNARANILNTLSSGFQIAQGALAAATSGANSIRNLLRSLQLLTEQAAAAPLPMAQIGGAVPLTSGTRISNLFGDATHLAWGDRVTVSDGSTTATYVAGLSDTVQTFLDAVNGSTGLQITASLDANGLIQLSGGGGISITVNATYGGPGTIDGVLGFGVGTTVPPIETTRRRLAEEFDRVRAQIDQAAFAASFKGLNLLTGGMFELRTSEAAKLSIAGVKFTAADLGLAASIDAFQSDTQVSSARADVEAALTTVANRMAVLESTQKVVDARDTFNKLLASTLLQSVDDTLGDRDETAAVGLAQHGRRQLAGEKRALAHGPAGQQVRQFYA